LSPFFKSLAATLRATLLIAIQVVPIKQKKRRESGLKNAARYRTSTTQRQQLPPNQ
jgi:hypothetical protein